MRYFSDKNGNTYGYDPETQESLIVLAQTNSWVDVTESWPPKTEGVVFAEVARSKRDTLLQQSDWTQVADAPVDQVAWATYRQALRDITTQEGFPEAVVWPVAPN